MKTIFNIDARRAVFVLVTWGAWLASFGGTAWSVLGTPSFHQRQLVGLVVVLLIGIAIAGTQALGRMRLTGAITSVFEAGMHASMQLRSGTIARSCIVKATSDWTILSIINADVIGWAPRALLGRNIENVIPARCSETIIDLLSGIVGGKEPSALSVIIPVADENGAETLMRASASKSDDAIILCLAIATV